MIDSSPSFDLTSIFDLNYPNVLNSTLKDIDISFGNDNWDPMMCKIVIPFMNKLYACSNEIGTKECYSWDIETGEKETHPPVNVEFAGKCYFSLVEVNGQIWANGGHRAKEHRHQTAFLLPNLTWTEGPNLPYGKSYHASIAIDEKNVVIFGGYKVNHVWIFNGETMTFEIMNSYPIGPTLNVCKIRVSDKMDDEVILVKQSTGKMYTYDWKIDVWSKLDNSWDIPSSYHYNNALYLFFNRYMYR